MTKASAPLGILGDGQLALMLGEAAERHGIPFLAFGESLDSSFARAFPKNSVIGISELIEDLISFAKQCSVVTLENEFFPADILEVVARESGTPIIPDAKSYRHFETKLAQRNFYASLKLSAPKWARAEIPPDLILTQIEKEFSYPLVLKASRGGYDGYGVRVLKNPAELPEALKDLRHSKENPVLIEEKVSIQKEFAQGALFDGRGGAILLPLVETVQRNGICELVLSRSTLPEAEFSLVSKKITEAMNAISKSGIVGLFSFEFFYTGIGEVFINEGAPRPHNSQHLGLDASPTSQFDLLVSFLATGKLPDIASPIAAKPGVMINLLGKSVGTDYKLTLPALPNGVLAHPKLYFKKESRVGRKMGHLNLIDPSGEHDLVKLGERLLKEYYL
jgi:5-(carboxyamino)imidazole ribonucleotide synthase